MLVTVPYVVLQVQMGVLPAGRAAALLPPKPPPIS
jgi:hypothetical protein